MQPTYAHAFQIHASAARDPWPHEDVRTFGHEELVARDVAEGCPELRGFAYHAAANCKDGKPDPDTEESPRENTETKDIRLYLAWRIGGRL
eukprot:1373777-Amorphochlora_amoeboformis.AAC.2